jgi:hypothetical protein
MNGVRAVVLITLLAGCTASTPSAPGIQASPTKASSPPKHDVVPARTCEQAIGVSDPNPEPGVGRIVLGRVWFPSTPPDVLQPTPPRTPEGNLSFKAGIGVRAGTPVTITVPDAFSHVYALDFANVPLESTSAIGEGQRTIRIQPCPRDSQGPWTAFSGGFLAPERACIDVLVGADARTKRLRMGLGTKC